MRLYTKYFLQVLKNTVHHSRNSKCCSSLNVRLYSQTKPPIFLFPKHFANAYVIPLSQGRIQLSRFFSCKDLLKSEQENWKGFAANYKETIEKIRQKLEAHYDKYSSSLNNMLVRFGEYVYLEENGCIYRLKVGEVDEGNIELLLSPEDVPFPDYLIQRIRISPDHRYMATGIKSTSSEESSCIIMKLNTLPKVECIIPNVFSFEWARFDILFYTIQKHLQCHDVYLSDFRKKDFKMVYTEQDARRWLQSYNTITDKAKQEAERHFVDLCCTKDKRFLTINSNSKTTSEVWLVDCHHPLNSPILVQQRTEGVIYHVEHRNNELYILTTYGDSMGYKLMKAPVGACGVENWQPIYTVKEKTKLVDLEVFKDNCIAFLKSCSHLSLDCISLVSNSVHSVKLPAWACSFELESHSEFNSSTCYFWLNSPVQLPGRFEYSLAENNLIAHTEQEGTTAVTCHPVHLEAKSKDGTWVPITVFHKADSIERQRKPLLIHVYGAYGTDVNMSFKPENVMLIQEGWILAYCHVRGGGELGLGWHKDGCKMKKHKGIQDLKACLKLLHELGYSQPMYTALRSLSAGGVLAGAVYNSEPYLIRAMVLQAPFLNVLNTMLDPHLPLTIEEQEEWGDPLTDETIKEYIKSYCPYQNIRPQHYPSVFISVSEKDQRVPLAGILRYICKLRKAVMEHAQADSAEEKGLQLPNIILDLQPGGSHCAPTWEDSLNQVAAELAFLYHELGLDKQK